MEDKTKIIRSLGWGKRLAEFGLAVLIVGIPASIFSQEINNGVRYLKIDLKQECKLIEDAKEKSYTATQPYVELALATRPSN